MSTMSMSSLAMTSRQSVADSDQPNAVAAAATPYAMSYVKSHLGG